jgi:hypothetical protein
MFGSVRARVGYLVARRLAGLYAQGGVGLVADPQQATLYEARATELGL